MRSFVDFPTPVTRTELRKFINSMGFFRNSIPNYAELSFDLQELVNSTDPSKKGYSRFRLTEKHLSLFNKMKEAAEKYLPLYEIDPAKPLYAFSDASKRSVGFVAFQLEGPDEHVVCPGEDSSGVRTQALMDKVFGKNSPGKRFAFCFSRKLTPAERNYSIFKLEIISCLSGLQAARDILLFRPIILFIDARSLMFIRLCRNSSEQIARLSIQLSAFEVELYHIPSEMNLADNYTRLREPDTNDEENENLRSLSEKESHQIVKHLMMPENFSIPIELLQGLLNEDGVLINLPGKKKKKRAVCKEIPRKNTCPSLYGPKKLKDFVIEVRRKPTDIISNMVTETENEMEDPGPSEYNALQDLVTSTGIFQDGLMTRANFRNAQENDVQLTELIKTKKLKVKEVDTLLCVENTRGEGLMGDKGYRPIIPGSLLKWYALSIHLDSSTYHMTSPQILRLIKQQFYVINENIVRSEISRCFICQISTPNVHTRHKFALQQLPNQPRSHIAFDICCGLPDDDFKYRYIYCAVDQYSNYTIASAAKSRSVGEILTFFRLALFAYTVPSLLLVDGELGLLNSKQFADFLALYDIRKMRTSLSFPQSNGLSERTNYFIKKCLRCFVLTHKRTWSEFVPHIVSAINNSVMSYHHSPNQITFGSNDEHRANLITLNKELTNVDEYVEKLIPFVEKVRKDHRKRKLDRVYRNLSYINRNKTTKTFEPGDVVLIQDVRLIANKAGRCTYRPAIVLDITKSKSCALVQALESNRVLKYHFTYIKPLTKPLFLKLPEHWQNKVIEANRGELDDSGSQDFEYASQDASQGDEGSQEDLNARISN